MALLSLTRFRARLGAALSFCSGLFPGLFLGLSAGVLSAHATCGASALGASQDDAASLEKLKRFLDQRPYHDRVFTQLDSAATAAGQRDALRAEYAARLSADPEDDAARIVLARIEARTRRIAEALLLLAELTDRGPELARLRGELYLASAQFAPAAMELTRAADALTQNGAAVDVKQLEDVLRTLARTHLALRDEDAAVAALTRLAELEPTSPALRIDAAREMADLGLHTAALTLFEEAAALAHDDPARFVQACVAHGALCERRGALREADASFARAMERLGGGHWRRAELVARRKALHTRLGTLPAFAAELRALAEREPAEPALRVQLAEALTAAGAREEALQELARAAAEFADSLPVSMAYADALASAGETLPAVVEYQRSAARHPREPRLHLAAGTLLATAGDLGGAEAQWALELGAHPTSIELRLELAALADQFGQRTRAEALLRDATRLAPGDLRPVRAAIALLGSTQPLDAAEQAALAQGDADLLEELAFEWLEREDLPRATKLLRAALQSGGDETRLLGALVELGLSDATPSERAAALLRHAELAREPTQRVARVAYFAQVMAEDGRIPRALSEVRKLADVPLRVALEAHLHAAAGDTVACAAALQELRALDSSGEESLRHTATLAEATGETVNAIAAWTELAERVPRARVEALQELARVQRRAGLDAPAREVEDALVAAAPRNVAVLRDVALRAARAKEHDRARELLERVLALDPRDAASRYDLAQVYFALGAREAAIDELCAVLTADDEALRKRARQYLMHTVLRAEHVELRSEVARIEAERTELTLERGLLWSALLRERALERDAVEVLHQLLAREPLTGALAEQALAAYGASFDRSLGGVTASQLRATLEAHGGGEALWLAEATLRAGNVRGAERALEALDPVLASQVALALDAPELAVRLLKRAVREQPADSAPMRRLAVAHACAGETGRAVARLEDWLSMLPADHSRARHAALLELGELHALSGSRSGLREVGEALFAALAGSHSLLSAPQTSVMALRLHEERVADILEFHLRHDLEREFVRSALAAPREDLALTVALAERALRPSERKALEERAATRPYGAWTESEWRARSTHSEGPARPRARWGQLGTVRAVNGDR
jgi:predicted Zn-dependent protease